MGLVRWCWTNLKDECSRANSSKMTIWNLKICTCLCLFTFDILMTWFCVERWRLGVIDSETHRWMSIRTDPNNPFMAAAVAWNGKLHPWLNTDGQFREHCSWVEFLVPFVRDMLRAQHFFLVHSEGHCKLEHIPCCVTQSLQSRQDETHGFSWNCALNGSILLGFSIVYSTGCLVLTLGLWLRFKLFDTRHSSLHLSFGAECLADSIRVLPPQDWRLVAVLVQKFLCTCFLTRLDRRKRLKSYNFPRSEPDYIWIHLILLHVLWCPLMSFVLIFLLSNLIAFIYVSYHHS